MLKAPVAGFPAMFVLITGAFACGDKMLLSMGSLRYRQLVGGAQPAAILAYVREDSAVAGIIRDLQAHPALKQAGHTFYAADDPAKVAAALKAGKYDILLVDVSDVEKLVSATQLPVSNPVLLPVVHVSRRAEASAIEKRFHCILKAPDNPGRYLAAINKAMELRAKAPLQ